MYNSNNDIDPIDLGGMRLFAGTREGQAGMEWSSVMPSGLTICILLQGFVDCRFEAACPSDVGNTRWQTMTFGTVQAARNTEIRHRIDRDATLSGAFLHLTLEEIICLLGDEAERVLSHGDEPLTISNLVTCPRRLQSLAWQMIGCPLQGTSRRLYLSGKALELLAFALDETRAACNDCPLIQNTSLTPRDIERLHAARQILRSELANPPTLAALAARIGTNAAKLSAGFRDLFGTSVYAFVKAARLDEARMLLEAGETSISDVARHLGYHRASFATAFRQRFGVTPSTYLATKTGSAKQ